MMRFGPSVVLAAVMTMSVAAAAQAPAEPPTAGAAKPSETTSAHASFSPAGTVTANWARYCSAEAGFCVKYPNDWKKQKDVLQGVGVVVAHPQDGESEELWPQITAASTLLPEEPEGKESPGFEDVLNVMLGSIEPGAHKQTLERKQTTTAGLPAQRVKIKYTDPNGKPWIEDGVFIDGQDAIYSVVLRCRPEQVAALEPAFIGVVGTWRPYEGSATPGKPSTRQAPAATPAPR